MAVKQNRLIKIKHDTLVYILEFFDLLFNVLFAIDCFRKCKLAGIVFSKISLYSCDVDGLR